MVSVFTAASMLFSLLLFSFTLPPGLDFHIFKLFCYASSLLSYKIFGNVWQIVSFAFLTFCSIVLRCFCLSCLLSALPFTCLLFLLKIVTHNNLLCCFFVLFFIGIFCPFCHVHEFFFLDSFGNPFPYFPSFFHPHLHRLRTKSAPHKTNKNSFTQRDPCACFYLYK